jgi:hypothetical protein
MLVTNANGMAHARFARDDAPIEPQPFSRVPFEDIAPAQNLQPGLIDRLALFRGHRGRHVIDACRIQFVGSVELAKPVSFERCR